MHSIKPGIGVKYVEWEGYPENEVIVKSRAGKTTSKNKDWWNTIASDGTKTAVHFGKVFQWNILPGAPEIVPAVNEDTEVTEVTEQANSYEISANTILHTTNKSREMNAKLIELKQWKDMDV